MADIGRRGKGVSKRRKKGGANRPGLQESLDELTRLADDLVDSLSEEESVDEAPAEQAAAAEEIFLDLDDDAADAVEVVIEEPANEPEIAESASTPETPGEFEVVEPGEQPPAAAARESEIPTEDDGAALQETLEELDLIGQQEPPSVQRFEVEFAGDKGHDIDEHLDTLFGSETTEQPTEPPTEPPSEPPTEVATEPDEPSFEELNDTEADTAPVEQVAVAPESRDEPERVDEPESAPSIFDEIEDSPRPAADTTDFQVALQGSEPTAHVSVHRDRLRRRSGCPTSLRARGDGWLSRVSSSSSRAWEPGCSSPARRVTAPRPHRRLRRSKHSSTYPNRSSLSRRKSAVFATEAIVPVETQTPTPVASEPAVPVETPVRVSLKNEPAPPAEPRAPAAANSEPAVPVETRAPAPVKPKPAPPVEKPAPTPVKVAAPVEKPAPIPVKVAPPVEKPAPAPVEVAALMETPAPAVDPVPAEPRVELPEVITRIEPVVKKRSRGAQGTVVLNVLVNERGQVVRVVVDQGIPGSALEAAAIDAILRWKYRPGTEDGRPARAWVTETFVFEP